MSNPTRKEIIAMHRSLNRLCDLASETAAVPARINEKVVRDALPPLPKLTMDEIEWSDSEHYLAEADHDKYGNVIMLGTDELGLIDIFKSPLFTKRSVSVEPETLTPTGRRYALKEIENENR